MTLQESTNSQNLATNVHFHSFISLFSIYPYTGKTKDVEMVVTDVKVSVRITDVNDYIQLEYKVHMLHTSGHSVCHNTENMKH